MQNLTPTENLFRELNEVFSRTINDLCFGYGHGIGHIRCADPLVFVDAGIVRVFDPLVVALGAARSVTLVVSVLAVPLLNCMGKQSKKEIELDYQCKLRLNVSFMPHICDVILFFLH